MDSITTITLAELHESPFNPRKHFDEASLAELAQDIRTHGRVLQPLLVRPRVPPLFAGDPEGQVGYEVVFGHRRLRAAKMAGLDSVHCMVRTMDDAAVKRAQISENLQRADVHAIEEAEGFQTLIDEHNMTADLLAEQFGKSRSHIYGRLKLLALCPEVRMACMAGEIGSQVGLLIARVGGSKLQEKALSYIRGRSYDPKDGGKASFRDIQALLSERFMLNLKEAIFDIEEEMLVPAAGNCVSCYKRSGNAPEFDDIVAGDNKRHHYSLVPTGPNVCTDPDCFDAKKRAHLKREAEKLQAAGKSVIDGNKARQAVDAYGKLKGGFIPLSTVRAELKKVAADKKPEVFTIQDPRTGKTVEAVKATDIHAAGLKQAEQKAPKPSGWEVEQAKREKAAQEEAPRRLALFERAVAAIRKQERTEFDMRVIARFVLDSMSFDDEDAVFQVYQVGDRAELEELIDSMSAFDVGALMMTVAMSDNVSVDRYRHLPAKHLDAAVAEYGITLNDCSDPTSTPSSAAQAPEEGVSEDSGQSDGNEAGATTTGAQGSAKVSRKSRTKKSAPTAKKQNDDAGSAGAELVQVAAWPFPRPPAAEVA